MTNSKIEMIPGGGITYPRGFSAGAAAAGIKGEAGALDLGLLCADRLCTCAGLFTRNLVKAAPVLLSQKIAGIGKAQALVVNSGCANACTGIEGEKDSRMMAQLAAEYIGISEDKVLVASTGVIGQRLSLDKIGTAIKNIKLSADGGHRLARSIMTTDTYPKEVAVKVTSDKFAFSVGGVAKGAGMIHPDMATMLCFLTTDANIDAPLLRSHLEKAVNNSFNMITIDGDTSTNDTVVVLATGHASRGKMLKNSEGSRAFGTALSEACLFLAREVARDGEGATRLIEVQVNGARNSAEARKAARTVAGSNLVKTAVHGADPNWGRVIAALGRSGARFQLSQVDLYLGGLCMMKSGTPQLFERSEAESILHDNEVVFRIELNSGYGKATSWGCDLSEEYVVINSAYTT